ncbi:MAG: 3-isopropylmalate dehydratase large subunit [Candidatus Eremiobacteraeota bacterium]|nr:3-isopropylmalate dehydratase large subunit [Candidatus Eremiobacteraeota bacterium]
MGKTIIEKILQNHTEDRVEPGKIVWIELDVRSARDFAGANVVKNFEKHFPGEKVENPDKTFFTFDCNVPANTIAYAENQHLCRLFARKQGIQVYDVDAGIGSHVMLYEGLALPGGTVVGTDSHLNIMGAIGCFGQGMGDSDIAFAFKTGKTWFEVPETIKITINGTYDYPTTGKDLILFILGKMGAAGALGKCVELYGEMVDRLDLEDRITVASMGTEMGAISIVIPPSDEIIKFYRDMGKKFNPVFADPDAKYSQELEFDIQGLRPHIAKPPHPDDTVPVDELDEIKVDSVFIGSCTNGTYKDIKIAADILKGKKVAPGVMVKVVPATRETYGRLLEDGIIQVLFESGVIVSNPGCGGCAQGQIGMTGKGEVQISTSNRNFKGKQGSGFTYLASTVTASASAITGKIATLPARVIVRK